MSEMEEIVGRQFKAVVPKGEYLYRETKGGVKYFLYTGCENPGLDVEWTGLHIGTLVEGVFQPTIEGAQLLGPSAGKNVVSVSREEAEKLMSGEEIMVENSVEGVVLLEVEELFFGAGKSEKGKIKQFITKSRLLKK
ncbi:MAG: hypothetical protein ABH851_01325 [Methanobacteriota archaeon]